MKMKTSLLKSLLIGIAGVIVSFFIAYCFNSYNHGGALFFDTTLSQVAHARFVRWVPRLILFSVIIQAGLIVLSQVRVHRKRLRRVFDNICKKVFFDFFSRHELASQIKVTLFRACRGNSEKPYLKYVGRYQERWPKKRCHVKFRFKEGCAGFAYHLGQSRTERLSCTFREDEAKYIQESQEKLNLSEKQVKKLNDKAIEFLCIPVYFFESRKPWGILSIDSLEFFDFENFDRRPIEEMLPTFSTMLPEERYGN